MQNGHIILKLKAHLVEECDVLGDSIIESLLENRKNHNKTKIIYSDNGSNIDISSVVSIVSIVISAIDITLKLIDFKKERKEKTNKEKIIIHVLQDSFFDENEKLQLQDNRVKLLLKEIIEETVEN